LTVLSDSPEATQALAAALGASLCGGDVLALRGEMGAGKTTFVRGLARGLEADEDEVASPTYTLMHEYPGRLVLRHFDAWMEEREEAFLLGGGAEWLHDPAGVCVLEWAGRVAEHLPEEHLDLELVPLDLERRELRLTPRGSGSRAERWRALLEDLAARLGGRLEKTSGGAEPSGPPTVGSGA
jgi:tRNA threonylcarbamoyladenosine biosynthesis protein TsaE